MNQEETKFNDTLHSLFEEIVSSQKKKQKGELIDEMIESSPWDLKDPEEFSLLVNYPLTNAVELLVRTVHADINIERMDKLEFLFSQYPFLENNIKKLVDQKEPYSYGADKSRWLLESYKTYLLEGALPDMTVDEKTYCKPAFGSAEEWIDFIEGLHHLYYGRPENYLKALAALMENK